jgi:hypothetical protein
LANINYPDISPKQAKKLLGGEIGTSFDIRERMFSYWGDGTVFDYSSWSEADMKQMILRDGQAAALEAVLTLPIRQADWSIMPTKGDKGEAEFVRSVLLQPAYAGGMKTPMQTVIGQATAAQVYKKAYFLAPLNSRRYSASVQKTEWLFMTSLPIVRRLRARFGVRPLTLSLTGSVSRSGSSADFWLTVRVTSKRRGMLTFPSIVHSFISTESTENLYRVYLS